jgi:hypothetical protein
VIAKVSLTIKSAAKGEAAPPAGDSIRSEE